MFVCLGLWGCLLKWALLFFPVQVKSHCPVMRGHENVENQDICGINRNLCVLDWIGFVFMCWFIYVLLDFSFVTNSIFKQGIAAWYVEISSEVTTIALTVNLRKDFGNRNAGKKEYKYHCKEHEYMDYVRRLASSVLSLCLWDRTYTNLIKRIMTTVYNTIRIRLLWKRFPVGRLIFKAKNFAQNSTWQEGRGRPSFTSSFWLHYKTWARSGVSVLVCVSFGILSLLLWDVGREGKSIAVQSKLAMQLLLRVLSLQCVLKTASCPFFFWLQKRKLGILTSPALLKKCTIFFPTFYLVHITIY